MIEKLAHIILGLGILGGMIGMLSGLRRSTPAAAPDSTSESERLVLRKKRFASSLHTFWISLAGLVFLLVKFSSVWEILGRVILVRGLIEVGLRNWKPKPGPESRPPHLTR